MWTSPPARSAAVVLFVIYEGTFHKRDADVGFYEAWVGSGLDFGLSGRWYPGLAGNLHGSRGAISYIVPSGWVVASVGRPAEESDAPSGRRFDFEITSPAGFSFAAGPFRAARRRVEGLDVGVFLLDGGVGKPEYYLENCARVAAFLRDYYGGLPFDGFTVTELPQDLLGSAGGEAERSFLFFPPMIMPEGYFFAPEFALSWSAVPRDAKWEIKGRIRQTRDVYRVTAEIAFTGGGARETKIVDISAGETNFAFLLPFKPDEALFDPDYKILRWIEEFKI